MRTRGCGRAFVLFSALFMLVVTMVGCAPSDGDPAPADAGCPNDLPQSCPQTPPSYQDQIEGVLEARCNKCHGPGGTAAEKPLLDYSSVYRQRGPTLDQVYGCRMPPSDSPQLSPQERHELLAWLVCGAPNN